MTDIVEIICGYEAWREAQGWANPTGPYDYAEHLETQNELRILKAVRFMYGHNNYIIPEIQQVLSGDENALKKVEAGYEA